MEIDPWFIYPICNLPTNGCAIARQKLPLAEGAMFAFVGNRRRRSTRHPVVGLLIGSAFLILLLAVACMSSSKEDVIREYLECQQERDPYFEESMMIMFPAAEDLDDAMDQYVYVSQAASLDDLKEARDWMCGSSGDSGSGGTGGSGGARQDSPPGTAQPIAQDNQDGQSNQGGQGDQSRQVGQRGSDSGGCGSGKFPNAAEIKDGETVEGNIGRAGWDQYCFQAEEGGTYLFEAVSGTLTDPFLQIGTSLHMEMGSAAELASGFGVAVFEAPSPDTYLLVVAADFGYSTDTGTYAVRMSRVEDDHPNTFSNATVVSVGQAIVGEVGYRADKDRFRVEVEEGRIYRFQMDSGGNEEIYWRIRSPSDQYLSHYGDGVLLWKEKYSYSYYDVIVRGAKGDDGEYATGPYSLTLSSYLPGEDDHGESAAQATPITAGETASGEIEYRGDIDFFRFQAEPGITYRVDVQFHSLEELEVYDFSGAAQRRLTVEELATQAEIVLYDGSGREVGRSWEIDLEAIEWGAEQRLLWAALEAATYHISLEFHYHLPYDLTLTAIPDQPEQSEGAPEIKIGQSMDGSVERGDVDYFRVQLVEGRKYHLYEFTSDFTDVWSVESKLFDDSGNAQSEYDEWGTVTAAYTGSYFLRVSDPGEGGVVPYRVYFKALD